MYDPVKSNHLCILRNLKYNTVESFIGVEADAVDAAAVIDGSVIGTPPGRVSVSILHGYLYACLILFLTFL